MVTRTNIRDTVPTSIGISRGRGRPARQERCDVANDIIRATEAFLENRSPQQITAKEIASLAGTRPTMVYYYFGSMEGLLSEIIRIRLGEITDEYRILWTAISNNEVSDPLRSLISLLASSFNRRPGLSRLLTTEMFREDSLIRSSFLEQWPARAKLIMRDVITHISTTEHYREDIDVEGVVSVLRSVIFFPLIIKPYLLREDGIDKRYLDAQWVDFVTEFFNCYLRSKNSAISP